MLHAVERGCPRCRRESRSVLATLRIEQRSRAIVAEDQRDHRRSIVNGVAQNAEARRADRRISADAMYSVSIVPGTRPSSTANRPTASDRHAATKPHRHAEQRRYRATPRDRENGDRGVARLAPTVAAVDGVIMAMQQ